MKKIILILGFLFLNVMFLSSCLFAAQIKEGQWSTTMMVKMEGAMGQEMAKAQKEMENMSPEEKAMMQQMMGNMGMQMGGANSSGMTITTKQCLTNANPVPKQEDQENCEESHSMAGNTVKFEVTCKDSHSTGEVTYDNNSMNGTIQSTQKNKGKEEKATIELKGQYLGPCKD